MVGHANAALLARVGVIEHGRDGIERASGDENGLSCLFLSPTVRIGGRGIFSTINFPQDLFHYCGRRRGQKKGKS